MPNDRKTNNSNEKANMLSSYSCISPSIFVFFFFATKMLPLSSIPPTYINRIKHELSAELSTLANQSYALNKDVFHLKYLK